MSCREKPNKLQIKSLILENKLNIFIVFILVLLFAGFEAIVPYSFSFIIDNAIMPKNLKLLTFIVIFLAVGSIIVAFSQVLRDYLYLDICSSYLLKIRKRIYDHMLNLSMGFYSKTQPGEIIARFSSDLAVVEQGLIYAPNYFLVPLVNVLISSVFLFLLDIKLAILSMLIFPAALVGPYILSPRASKAGNLRKRAEAGTLSDVQVTVSSQSVIKALNLQEISSYYFDKNNKRFYKSMLHALFTSSLVDRSGIVAVMILQIIVLAVGSYMTIYGMLPVGKLVAFQGLFLGLSYSLITTSAFVPMIIQTQVGIKRVNALLKEQINVVDQAGAGKLSEFSSEIKFDNVTFGYNKGNLNLKNLSLKIAKNGSVAFVGPSGCGKSTILNLIMRFYDPDTGKVLIDGVDLKTVTQNSLREQLGIVLQDNILFNITIMDNMLVAKLDATDEEVFEAAKMAEIHDTIMSMPEGYRTIAGERGSRLSGGQRQRIAIARALLRGGNILILDEATSALDPVSEAAINETLRKIAKNGKTIISVTHRLSSAIYMDKIFVMKEGNVIEEGSHIELLEKNGFYKQMWEKQK